MRILFVSTVLDRIQTLKAKNELHMLRHIPCDLMVCRTAADVRKHIKSADVVLLAAASKVPFQDNLEVVFNSGVLTCRFYGDIHRERIRQDSINPDVYIVRSWGWLERQAPEWLDSSFFSPFCVDIPSFDLPRDIDVVFWGSYSSAYKFRPFVRKSLRNLVVGQRKRVNPFLLLHNIDVSGTRYRYACVTPAHEGDDSYQHKLNYGYFGPRLFRLLSKSRIGCVGAVCPVAKYFENAACGVVTLTNAFLDRKALGFEHGKNIWFTNKKKFLRDLQYLLAHDDLVREISKNAKELIRTRHTPAIRGRELYEFLCEKTGKT